ncbi:MAG: HAMP domain-containing histidine kinase [Eubacterium sp.]|nr:HAMP domain-containing histidine kinase [Eubacterium sp.]
MNKKLLIILFIYTIAVVIAGQLVITHISKSYDREEAVRQEAEENPVKLNEVKQLIADGKSNEAIENLDEIIESYDDAEDTKSRVVLLTWIFVIINILSVVIILVYINIRILKPFEDMKEYASKISAGDLDSTLKMDRGNYFGAFTWAFDNMRREIVKSRRAEKEAIENNKTVIATLSHDIKTPMASIRAYAEAFEANMDTTPEKRQKYLSIMMQKCDEVSKLTNDLFLHSISEMDRLEVSSDKLDLVEFLEKDVRELFTEESEYKIVLPEGVKEGIYINADRSRLLQIIENMKSNAEKYAKTPVEIKLEVNTVNDSNVKETSDISSDDKDYDIRLHFRDFGPGIPDEEIPFITGKFYRGKNVGNENGSGLGLYIVKELIDRMGAKLLILNSDPGLDMVMDFKGI